MRRISKLSGHRNAAAATGNKTTIKRDKERSRSAEDGVKLNYAYEF